MLQVAPGQAQVGPEVPHPLDADQLRPRLPGHRSLRGRRPKAPKTARGTRALALEHQRLGRVDRRPQCEAQAGGFERRARAGCTAPPTTPSLWASTPFRHPPFRRVAKRRHTVLLVLEASCRSTVRSRRGNRRSLCIVRLGSPLGSCTSQAPSGGCRRHPPTLVVPTQGVCKGNSSLRQAGCRSGERRIHSGVSSKQLFELIARRLERNPRDEVARRDVHLEQMQTKAR